MLRNYMLSEVRLEHFLNVELWKNSEILKKQESIPVGCLLTVAVTTAQAGVGG